MARQYLYLNDWELSAYLQDRGGLRRTAIFPDSYSGREAFADHIAEGAAHASCLLVDLAEEDFQPEVMPHVSGQAQRALAGRRLLQYYRDTPYRRAARQGREQGGRRDDHMLFSALTNPARPMTWLSALSRHEVPLVGLYSLALLTEQLHKALRLPSEALLLITHQSSGLRQSYFHQGRLVFSRLTPLLDGSPDLFADALLQEINRTREFLSSTRQLPREERLDVAVLARTAMLAPLRPHCAESDSMRYHLMAPDAAAQQLGLKLAEVPLVCDALFLGLLANKAPPAHYPTVEQTRLYTLWRTRLALKALGGAVVAGAFAWTGLNALGGWEQYEKMRALSADTRAADSAYRSVLSSTPASDVSAHDMGAAVAMGRLLQQNGADPHRMLALVGGALERLPQISIERLHWQTQPAGMAATLTAAAGARPDGLHPAALVGLPRKPDQVLMVEGYIDPFRGDFRRALQDVQHFADDLGRHSQYQVHMVRLPLDVTPGARLEGRAGDGLASARATFSLKLIWTP